MTVFYEPVPPTPSPSPLSRLGRRLLVPLLLAVACCIGLAFYADARDLAGALWAFHWPLAVPVVALTLVNLSLRYLRWHLYLRWAGTPLPAGASLAILLVGFPLGVTPGRAGELGKGWLVRALGGGRARDGVAVVLAERLVDGLAFCLLVAGIGLWTPIGTWLRIFAVLLAAATVGFLVAPIASRHLVAICRALPGLRRVAGQFEDVLARVRVVLGLKATLLGILVGIVAFGAEALSCALIVRSYAPQASWSVAGLIYCVSSLIGGLSMLPGGMVATEGALTVLLERLGIPRAVAASATLLTRAGSLWLAVLIGLAAVPPLWRRLRPGPARGVG